MQIAGSVSPSVDSGSNITSVLFVFFMAVLFIFGCAGSSLQRGFSLVVAYGLLVAVASLVAEHGL